MQRKLSKEFIEQLKELYLPGTKVKLLKMDDKQAPPVGTLGEVMQTDDIGTVHIKWANGSTLGAVYGEDKIMPLERVVTICYHKRQVWEKRQDAIDFFLEGMNHSEGSERERYTKVYLELLNGNIVCIDSAMEG